MKTFFNINNIWLSCLALLGIALFSTNLAAQNGEPSGIQALNLLINSGTNTNLSSWTIIQNQGNQGYYIDATGGLDGTGAVVSDFELNITQEIDLIAQGYDSIWLDSAPIVRFSDFIKGTGSDIGDRYRYRIDLMDVNDNIIDFYESTGGNETNLAFWQVATANWEQVTHNFLDYGTGLRKIRVYRVGNEVENNTSATEGVMMDGAHIAIGNHVINPSGKTSDMSGWTIEADGGNGWTANGSAYPAFQPSSSTCIKSQTINLLDLGYTAAQLDSEPAIEAIEWFLGYDTGGTGGAGFADTYSLEIELRDGFGNVIDSYDSGTLTASDSPQNAQHIFQNYGTGLREIYIKTTGDDQEGWAGHYGAIINGAQIFLTFSPLENDDCADATAITSFPYSSTENGSLNTGGSLTSCIATINDGLWYTFLGDGNDMDITITPDGWDAEVAIFSGACGSLSACLAGADDPEVVSDFPTTDGTTYYILVGSYLGTNDSNGIFDIEVAYAPPANDLCTTATPINCGDNLTDQSTNAATDNGDDTGCTMGTGVWYTYAGDDKNVKITVIPNENFDPEFTISSSTDCTTFNLLECVDNDLTYGGVESTTFYAVSGTTYYIYVGHWDNIGISTGDFDIKADCYNCNAPYNANVAPTATSALVTWDTGNGGASQSYQVKYRLKGTSAWSTLGATNTQRNIPNLTAKKYYQYKVREKCSDNTWSDFTEIETFYTSACDAPTGVASIYLDDTRMRVRWDNNPDEIKGKIRYRVVGYTNWITQNSQDGQNFLYVNDFPAGATEVQYKVRSNCDGNDWSEYSSLMTHYLGSVTRLAQEETALTATNIYPNPTRDVLNVEFETVDAEEVNIRITDNLGKTISSQNNTYGQGVQKETLDVARLANGYYFITIQSNDRMETKKFMKME